MECPLEEYTKFVKEGIKNFREWYQPIDFGYGIVAHVQEFPDYILKPDFMNNKLRGMSKWNFIIKPNLPDIQGKRILDLGCSSGLNSIQLALDDAKEVVGIDRDFNIYQKSNKQLCKQDVISQAEFVKRAFEMRTEKKMNIKFIRWDIGNMRKLDLGNFDLIMALCIVYHEMSKMPKLLETLTAMSDLIILQTNLLHKGKLGKWASIETHIKIMSALGFDVRFVEGEPGYPMPLMIFNRKKSIEQKILVRLFNKFRLIILKNNLLVAAYKEVFKTKAKNIFKF